MALDEWLTEQEVSERLRIPVNTLRYWRGQKRGLPYAKVGALVRYSESAVQEYLDSHVEAVAS